MVIGYDFFEVRPRDLKAIKKNFCFKGLKKSAKVSCSFALVVTISFQTVALYTQ
jgi:hypothetical protein